MIGAQKHVTSLFLRLGPAHLKPAERTTETEISDVKTFPTLTVSLTLTLQLFKKNRT